MNKEYQGQKNLKKFQNNLKNGNQNKKDNPEKLEKQRLEEKKRIRNADESFRQLTKCF